MSEFIVFSAIIVAAIIAIVFVVKLWLNKVFKPISKISFECTMEEITDQLFDRNW
jgi:NADH:ubiquinone oxidoreductase subunit 3 (subunit A)